jgi:hypothetical protein
MTVPTAITDLSTTAANNSPAGGENVFPQLDNYLRAAFSFIAQLQASQNFIGLGDTPTAYTDAAYKLPRVNAAATAMEFVAPGNIRIVNVSASRDLLATDFGALLVCSSASTITLTLPPFATLAVAAENSLVAVQWGAGKVTFAPGSGVTLRAAGSLLSTRAQFSQTTLIKTDTNEALIGGDTAA